MTEPQKDNTATCMVKVLVMMTGEVNYNDIYYRPYETLVHQPTLMDPTKNETYINVAAESLMFPVTAHIVLACFVIFVTIIMMNLLVGIAISDVQEIQKLGHLNLLVHQIKIMDLVDENLAIVVRVLPGCKFLKKMLFGLERYYCLDFDVNKMPNRCIGSLTSKREEGCLYAIDGPRQESANYDGSKAQYNVPRTLNAQKLAVFAKKYK